MAVLRILEGLGQVQEIPLRSERLTFGREHDRDVVIPAGAVSRKHAQIVRAGDRYWIEDLGSRNHTYVNNLLITHRTPLKHNDRIRICDFVAVYEEEDPDSSVVMASMSHSSFMPLEAQPAEKLKALLEISTSLSTARDSDTLLPLVGDALFRLFRQADRCFVIMAAEDRLMPRLVQTRRGDAASARFSRGIVRRCLETGEAFLSADVANDPRVDLSQSVLDARIRSVLCAPLLGGEEGKPAGVIQLDTQDQRKTFTVDDLKLLCGVASQASVALENARFHAERVVRERHESELQVAAEVQRSFLPASLPQVAGYDFFAAYEPARAVGGDYYDFIALPDGRLAVAVGDVAGKGVPAALLMVKLAADFRLCLLTREGPDAVLSALNGLLAAHTQATDRFVTLCLAILDPRTHTVTLASAGHGSPLLYRRTRQALGPAMPAEVPGMPLGLVGASTFSSCQVVLQAGDVVILYTDGVTDAAGAGRSPLGTQGLHSAALGAGGFSPSEIGKRIHATVQQHGVGSAAQVDDMTLVCFGRRE